MKPVGRRIAVLGAPGSGAAQLAGLLREALADTPDDHITEHIGGSDRPSLVLLMGLDLPLTQTSAEEQAASQDFDNALRQQLQALNVPYRVIYGSTLDRLSHALLALGRSPQHSDSHTLREQAQYLLNQGRTLWSCETCSDPDCEHRLFTSLIKPTGL